MIAYGSKVYLYGGMGRETFNYMSVWDVKTR